MELVKWDNSLSVGVKVIDEQHKNFVTLLNGLFAAMKVGKGKDVLDKLLNELANYTVYHFSTEEKYFDKYKYEETLDHKAEHKNFISTINDFMSKYNEGKAFLTLDLFSFLKEWLINHIKVEDKKYTPFFMSNGIN